jgi:hypothetical protein
MTMQNSVIFQNEYGTEYRLTSQDGYLFTGYKSNIFSENGEVPEGSPVTRIERTVKSNIHMNVIFQDGSEVIMEVKVTVDICKHGLAPWVDVQTFQAALEAQKEYKDAIEKYHKIMTELGGKCSHIEDGEWEYEFLNVPEKFSA